MDHRLDVDPLDRDRRRSPMSPSCGATEQRVDRPSSPRVAYFHYTRLCGARARKGALAPRRATMVSDALCPSPPLPLIFSVFPAFFTVRFLSRARSHPVRPLFFLSPAVQGNVALHCLPLGRVCAGIHPPPAPCLLRKQRENSGVSVSLSRAARAQSFFKQRRSREKCQRSRALSLRDSRAGV